MMLSLLLKKGQLAALVALVIRQCTVLQKISSEFTYSVLRDRTAILSVECTTLWPWMTHIRSLDANATLG